MAAACGVSNGFGAERAETIAPFGTESDTLEGYDIDLVVDAVIKGMSDAARNYYLPDKPGNAKRIKKYTEDSRKLVLMSTSFKRELGQVCIDVAKAASRAGRNEEKFPGQPLILTSGLTPVPEGVSSKTVSMDGEVMTVFTNTLPCINAAGGAINSATLGQFPRTAREPAAKKEYGQQLGAVLTANRLFNHTLANVCSQLVTLADRYSTGKR